MAKGLHLACELVRAVGVPAHMGLIMDDALQRAQTQGWGQQGDPVVRGSWKRSDDPRRG